jgi:hypothetical protein
MKKMEHESVDQGSRGALRLVGARRRAAGHGGRRTGMAIARMMVMLESAAVHLLSYFK